ncbi:Kinetochore null protein [Dirofilaria immitis]
MEKTEKERRSSILKPQQPLNIDNGELSTTITATVKRRVSFHTIRTVQEFDVEHSKIVHSPHNEPMKLYDTTSSDGLTSEQLSASESSDGYAAKMNINKLNQTVENFMPVTTSTPLPCLKDLNDLSDNSAHANEDTYNDVRCCHSAQYNNITAREETNGALDHISENEELDILEVESMEMSDSNNPSPVTTDATRKLFRQSAVLRHFTATPNRQSSANDETLASNATRLIFKDAENNKCQSEAKNQGLKMDSEKSSVTSSYVGTADMDISFDDDQVPEVPIDVSFKQLSIAADVVDETTGVLFGTNNVDRTTEASDCEKDSKSSIVMVDNTQISNDVSSNIESAAPQVNIVCDLSVKSVGNIDGVAYVADNNVLELSSLDRQHISNESLSSIRKTALQSPAVLPKKKIRLFSPKVTLPPKTRTLLFGSPKVDAARIASNLTVCPSDKTDLLNTSEITASTDKSTDEVLTEIKHKLRRSLNQSGIFTLTELSAADDDNVGMLYDIPMPEPLFHPNELNSQVSTSESFNNEVHTTAEESYVESSSLSSRRSEIVTAALGNESSFLTSRVDTVGFNINFRTIPCLRVKPNEQPQIVELKQLATTNLRKRITEVVDRCKGLINTQLPNCENRKIAECIRTLNPRKLSKKEANWFDVCYLMAQREWFVLRAKLAKLTSEKLDELLLETKAESDQKKQLAQSVKDYQQSRDEVMQRYDQLKLLNEVVNNEAQNEMKLNELKHAIRAGHLEIAQKKLELTKKQGTLLEVLLNEYDATKFALEKMTKKAAERAEFLQKYDDHIIAYRELLTEKGQSD